MISKEQATSVFPNSLVVGLSVFGLKRTAKKKKRANASGIRSVSIMHRPFVYLMIPAIPCPLLGGRKIVYLGWEADMGEGGCGRPPVSCFLDFRPPFKLKFKLILISTPPSRNPG